MINKADKQKIEVRENMRGGEGKITIKHYFSKEDITAPCRLCADLIIPPGASIGEHEHQDEDEIYIVKHGVGIISGGEKEMGIVQGDAILTGNGGKHAVRNTADTDLVITAVIMKY